MAGIMQYQLYATKTKGRYRGQTVLVGESLYPYSESRIAEIRKNITANSLEYDRNVRIEVKTIR